MVLRSGLQHDAARLEVLEVAVLDVDVSIDSHDAGRVGIICGVTLQLAVDHLDAGSLQHRDTRHLPIGFPENTTKETHTSLFDATMEKTLLTRGTACNHGVSDFHS